MKFDFRTLGAYVRGMNRGNLDSPMLYLCPESGTVFSVGGQGGRRVPTVLPTNEALRVLKLLRRYSKFLADAVQHERALASLVPALLEAKVSLPSEFHLYRLVREGEALRPAQFAKDELEAIMARVRAAAAEAAAAAAAAAEAAASEAAAGAKGVAEVAA